MLVIVDLECTCNEIKNSGYVSEIIEVGAVKFDLKTKEIVDQYQSFIRPKRNRILTDYCKQLTTITQEQVDSAQYFDSEYNRFVKWFGNPNRNLFCAWSEYDRSCIIRSCEEYEVEPRIGTNFWDIKRFYQEVTGKKGVGLARAIKQCGLEFDGTQHRALSDAINTARVLKKVLE